MQVTKLTGERPQRLQARPPLGGDIAAAGRSGRGNPAAVVPPRNRSVVPAGAGVRPKGNYGQREILRRALTLPPRRRISFRRPNFRPTPSRLSTMSTA
ncbi:uncharacterized protein LOC116189746 [Punica granatum]|uniref:Uncharacterized protein LOC116189746 n=1 Tax=Punica granatum TaxID=22663 RepID=A0A218X8W4_PUNGR|nr:uncharacterized protein LOC116189746 [Punica granatum]OWM81397.1 hypothetical protein CDL15_Pgr007435 [Punica granatum]